jgi:hypothetical protein
MIINNEIVQKFEGYKIISYFCNITIKQNIMPLLFTFFGLRFSFFSSDHLPIHVHVTRGKGQLQETAKFQVSPEVKLVENHGLKPSEVKLAEALIEENAELIIEKWNEFFKK